MKIGILQTGRTPEDMREEHGDYDALFRRFLGGRGFTFDTYPALDGVLPKDVHDADGWLITGSRFGVYEGHDWIAPLEEFLRRAFDAGVPIVGICFGHQVLAQALGGRVEKFSGGWSLGATEYASQVGDTGECIMAWHQDQVIEPPEGAEVLASSDFCRYAMLGYGDRALTIQPHPEFTPDFVRDLLVARADILPPDLAEQARARLDRTLTSPQFGDRVEAFFKRDRSSAAA